MSSNRHLARIIALQTLYEHEFRISSAIEGLTTNIDQITDRNLAVYQDSMSEDEFVRELITGTLKNVAKADAFIAPAAPEWPIDQIAKMDLTILRLAVFELMIKREVPPKVVINEAVELAKSFGGDNSSKFINGVLGTIYRQSKFYDPTEDHKVQRELGKQPTISQSKPAPAQDASAQRPAKQADQPEADDEPTADQSVDEPQQALDQAEESVDEPSVDAAPEAA